MVAASTYCAPHDGLAGFVTYDEVKDVLRRKLKKGPHVVSESRLKALWCSLDRDNSNQVFMCSSSATLADSARRYRGDARQAIASPLPPCSQGHRKDTRARTTFSTRSHPARAHGQVMADEFKVFIKLYTPPKRAVAKFGGKSFAKGGTFDDQSALTRAVASTPTAEMRAGLVEAGVELPEGIELTALSRKFNQGLEAARHHGTKNANSTASWCALYRVYILA